MAAAAACALSATTASAAVAPGSNGTAGTQGGASGTISPLPSHLTFDGVARFRSGTKYWTFDSTIARGRDQLKGTTKTQGDFNLSNRFSVEIDGVMAVGVRGWDPTTKKPVSG
jgi:hypothetical protein